MLGEPNTPLFCISAFISLDPSQLRAFYTSATSWRITTPFGSSGYGNTLPFVHLAVCAILLVSVVTLNAMR